MDTIRPTLVHNISGGVVAAEVVGDGCFTPVHIMNHTLSLTLVLCLKRTKTLTLFCRFCIAKALQIPKPNPFSGSNPSPPSLWPLSVHGHFTVSSYLFESVQIVARKAPVAKAPTSERSLNNLHTCVNRDHTLLSRLKNTYLEYLFVKALPPKIVTNWDAKFVQTSLPSRLNHLHDTESLGNHFRQAHTLATSLATWAYIQVARLYFLANGGYQTPPKTSRQRNLGCSTTTSETLSIIAINDEDLIPEVYVPLIPAAPAP